MNAPCKDCPDRTVTPNCHTGCAKYLAFQAERERLRVARRADHDATHALVMGAMKIKKEALRRSKGR